MKIIPGILEDSYNEIDERVQSVSEYVDLVHVDICDGQFVPSQTWPYSHMITGKVEQDYHIRQLLSEDTGLPEWEKLDYQFDLMIKDPWHNMEIWGRIGASSIVLHYAAFPTVEKFVETYEIARSFLLDVGMAATFDEYTAHKPEILEIFDKGILKFFQTMDIKHIGVQGEPFDNRWSAEVGEIKKQYPDLWIQADGGIHEDSILKVRDSGVDSVIIGSGIFAEGNAGENVQYFTDIVRGQ
ncbi:MAG: hypothetical protein RJB39_614 [Candidatus Parcubacteria bacterium]|jgi:pentose-5-phosphate-3-epimerase